MKQVVFRRILALCMAVALLTAMVASALFERREYARTKEALQTVLHTAATTLTPGGDGPAQLQQLAKLAPGVRYTLIDREGKVLADTQADPAAMENHLQRPEVQEALAAGNGSSTRQSATLGHAMLYIATALQNGPVLRAATEYRGFWGGLMSFAPLLAAVLFLSFLLSLWLSKRVATDVTKPLSEMSDNLRLLRDGPTPLDPTLYQYDELSEMAGNINHLSKDVQGALSALTDEKKKIEYILDNMQEGLMTLDPMENVLTINRAACAMLGCTKEVLGKNVIHATRNTAFLDALNAVGEKQEPASVDLSTPDKRIIEVNISPVQAGAHQHTGGGTIAVLSEVTADRAAVQMRREFFATASHELKTPLTSIKGFAELLSTDPTLPQEQKALFLQRILKETDLMTELINDIIMVSRLETELAWEEREEVALDKLVRETCASFDSTAKTAGVTLYVKTNPVTLSASPKELRELVGNLLQNAVKYNMPGGRVDVTLQNTPGLAVLSVHNTGEPIPPESMSRIFERFYRVDQGRSRTRGGTGLGLSIVKHVAEKYGAALSVESNQKDGTTFTVKFPLIKT